MLSPGSARRNDDRKSSRGAAAEQRRCACRPFEPVDGTPYWKSDFGISSAATTARMKSPGDMRMISLLKGGEPPNQALALKWLEESSQVSGHRNTIYFLTMLCLIHQAFLQDRPNKARLLTSLALAAGEQQEGW